MEESTTVHESRLAATPEAFKAPENHLFRKAYRQLSDSEKQLMDALKDKANELAQLIGQAPKGREASLGMTNLEQSIMWTVKAITG